MRGSSDERFGERSSQPSSAQVEVLVSFLEQHRHLARGYAKSNASREEIRRRWEQITKRLNAMGGTIKTAKQWTKHWSDKKSGIRKKMAARAAARKRVIQGSSPTTCEDIMFSDMEERMVALVEEKPGPSRIEPFSESQSSMSREVFDEDTEMSDQLSPSPEEFQTGEFFSINMDSVMPEPPSPNFVVKIEHINENEDEENEDELPLLPPTPAPAKETVVKPKKSVVNAFPSRKTLPQPQKDPLPTNRRPILKRLPANTRLKFRGSTIQPLPSSQLQKGESSATIERLLMIEEQQLELQRSNTKLIETLLEKSVERERLLVESLTSMAERDRLMTEALREGFQASMERMQERDRLTAEALRDGFNVLAEALNRR